MNTLDEEATRERRMDDWEHRKYCRERDEMTGRILEKFEELRAKAGQPSRKIRGRVVITARDDRSHFQVYLPDFSVAGEGRCACEASLEAFQQLEAILDSALEHRDWNVLPTPDNRLSVTFQAYKTDAYLWLLNFLRSRVSPDEIDEVESVKSVLARAV